MGKYVKMLSEADLKAEASKDPELAKFLKEKVKDRIHQGTHDLASMSVTLPPIVVAWLDANEDKETQKGAHEAFGAMLMACMDMLVGALPQTVRTRCKPAEAMEILADEVVECVYAHPFREAGYSVAKEYAALTDLTLQIGELGVKLSQAMCCARAHKKLVALADGRADIPDIDPALAAKATHNDHVTVQ